MSTPERPLGDVLAHRWDDFTPANPERAPWWQPQSVVDEVAYTGNVVTVNLAVADRVKLRGLERPTDARDDPEPFDWTPRGWGVGPTPT